MKKTLLISLGLAGATCLASAQNVRTFIEFELLPEFNPDNAVENDAGGLELDGAYTDTNPLTLPGYSPDPGGGGLLEYLYGPGGQVGDILTGNTISRSAFKSQVSQAYAEGRGGVIDFSDGNFTLSDEDFISPISGGPIGRDGEAAQVRAGGITIDRGENYYFEGDALSPYRGKKSAFFDGTGPSGPDRENFREVFFMFSGGSGLSNATSYDLDFNPLDKINTIGFSYRNWDNFQSFQEAGSWAGFPNMHGIATFTDGTDTIQQMAVGVSQQVSDGNDYFFGFDAPSGYFLENLTLYTIGNNARNFAALDEFGFVQVPEPGTVALVVTGLLGLGFLAWRRRR